TPAIHGEAGDRGHALQQRILVVVLHQRPDEADFAAWVVQIDLAIDVLVAAFPLVPAEIGADGDRADLLHQVLADVGHQHAAISRVPGETLRVAYAVREDLTQRVVLAVVGERIAGRNPVLAI